MHDAIRLRHLAVANAGVDARLQLLCMVRKWRGVLRPASYILIKKGNPAGDAVNIVSLSFTIPQVALQLCFLSEQTKGCVVP